MKVLILGCGYVGSALAAELATLGHDVTGVSRAVESPIDPACPGVRFQSCDITEPNSVTALDDDFDWVVNCVSSSRGGAEQYQKVFLDGTRNLLARFGGSRIRKYVHTSSTSVYGQKDGSEVDENSPMVAGSDSSRVLIAVEELLKENFRAQRFPAVIVRPSGIYGPDRGFLFQQFLKGESVISGQGTRHLNMVHREDVVGGIIAALQNGTPGEAYNVTDSESVTQLEFFRWLANELGRPMPPFGPEIDPATRKRGITDKRIKNERLRKELGYALKFPTFREGFRAEIARLRSMGHAL